MLIVARRKGQRILIGADIEIVVTEVSKGTVKLGIQAPTSYAIVRAEVHAAIAEANQSAAGSELAKPSLTPAASAPIPLVKALARSAVNGQTDRGPER
jgi:carbon storage regulator